MTYTKNKLINRKKRNYTVKYKDNNKNIMKGGTKDEKKISISYYELTSNNTENNNTENTPITITNIDDLFKSVSEKKIDKNIQTYTYNSINGIDGNSINQFTPITLDFKKFKIKRYKYKL